MKHVTLKTRTQRRYLIVTRKTRFIEVLQSGVISGEIHPYDDSLPSTNNVRDEIPKPVDKDGDPEDDNFKLDTCRTFLKLPKSLSKIGSVQRKKNY